MHMVQHIQLLLTVDRTELTKFEQMTAEAFVIFELYDFLIILIGVFYWICEKTTQRNVVLTHTHRTTHMHSMHFAMMIYFVLLHV